MNAITPISIDDLRRMVPSAFATEKYETCSDKYTFIPTIDAVEKLMGQGFVIASAKQNYVRKESKRGYAKHAIKMRYPGEQVVGEATPEVIITTAHDGTAALKILGGLLVWACTNGLVVSDGMASSVIIHHRGDIVEDVIAGTHRVMEQVIKSASVVGEWKGIQMSQELVDKFAKGAFDLRWGTRDGSPPQTTVNPLDLSLARRKADEPNNLWKVFNRVQENLIVGGIGYTTNNRGADGLQRTRNMWTRPINSITEDVKLNQGLWELAESFAKELA